jgi:signal transduction histidine kinase
VSFLAEPVRVEGRLPLADSSLARVLTNLLVNAIDALPEEGDAAVSISWSVTKLDGGQRDAIAVSVKDTGMGMSEEVRARIFEPYFTTKPEGEGTGLGLPTVFGIVQGVKGEVLVESSPGKGTTFTVVLPRLAG